MLAGDASEVVDQAERFLKTNSLIDYYDEVALPALLMAQVDLRRGVLDEPRQRRIKERSTKSSRICQIMSISRLQRHRRPSPLLWRRQAVLLRPLSSAPTLAPNPGIVAAPLPDLPLAGLTPSRGERKAFSASPAAVFSMKRLRHICADP